MSFPPRPSGSPWPSTHLDAVLERLDARPISSAKLAETAKMSALEKRMTETAARRTTPYDECTGRMRRITPTAVGRYDFSDEDADDEVARHPPVSFAAASAAAIDTAVPHEREMITEAAHPSPPTSDIRSLASASSKVSGKTYSHHIRALINHMYMYDMCKNCIAEDLLLVADSLYTNDSRK